jgi:hypothetical protein
MLRQALHHVPTPIDPFQLAKKFGLALDPRLAVVDDGEKFRFQLFSIKTGISFFAKIRWARGPGWTSWG